MNITSPNGNLYTIPTLPPASVYKRNPGGNVSQYGPAVFWDPRCCADPRNVSPPISPNRVPLVPGGWKEVPTAKACALVPLTRPTDFIAVLPDRQDGIDTTQAVRFAAGQLPVLWGPGKWWVWYNGAAALNCLVFDAPFASLVDALKFQAAGPLTMSAPTFGTVGVGSALLLAANPARRFLSLENTHATGVVSLGFDGAPAVAGSGVIIQPLSFKEWNMHGEDLPRGAIAATSTVAGTNVAIQEGI